MFLLEKKIYHFLSLNSVVCFVDVKRKKDVLMTKQVIAVVCFFVFFVLGCRIVCGFPLVDGE
jgi:hypothetical protein